jgi:diguanylate cyclase (GGDEF)-like protein
VWVRIYPIAKWFALSLLIIHIFLRLISPTPTIAKDLILYNAIVLVIIISLFRAPLYNDPLSIAFLSLATASWGIGSIASSLAQFFNFEGHEQLVSNIAYSLFYPFIFIAIPRSIARGKRFKAIEALDAAIFGLGLSSIIAAVLLTKLVDNSSLGTFFSAFYAVCDTALLVIILAAAATSKISIRLYLTFAGVLSFALTDFYYLWSQIQGTYHFGQFSDDGWLVGLVLLAISQWHQPNKSNADSKIHPALIAVSIFISPALLSAIALRPDYFPTYVVIPTISTLFLAFIRMSLVIRQANALGEEKILARTDELTGLPNRRRLIAELSSLDGVEGALLLLDLDGFKPINDQYGHEMGDRILRQVAQRFSRSLPSGAILARLGGDEFGIIAEGTNQDTLELVNALKATLSYPFTLDGKSISLNVSIGHVRNDGKGELLQRADLAMYEAKRASAEARAYLP